jgi:hypothetical protein
MPTKIASATVALTGIADREVERDDVLGLVPEDLDGIAELSRYRKAPAADHGFGRRDPTGERVGDPGTGVWRRRVRTLSDERVRSTESSFG